MLCSSKSDRDDFLFPKTARQGYPIGLKLIDFAHTGYNNPPKLGIFFCFFLRDFYICGVPGQNWLTFNIRIRVGNQKSIPES